MIYDDKKEELDIANILRTFKADLKASESARSKQDINVKRWRDAYNGELYGNEVRGKSQIISRDIKRQSAWLHPTLIEPYVSTNFAVNCIPVSADDRAFAEQSNIVLNSQFCTQFHRYNFMSKVLKILDIEGTAIVYTFWIEEKEVRMVEKPMMGIGEDGKPFEIEKVEEEEEVLITNKPSARVCRHEDIFRDPTCQDDTDNCQFTIYRYETDLSTLKRDGRFENLDEIDTKNTDFDFNPQDTSSFKFSDKAREKIVVYEYWGNYDLNGDGIAEPIVCCWVADTIIRLEDNPFPDKKQPFIIIADNSLPFQMYGESNSEVSLDTQKIKTACTRGIIDNLASANNGQKGFPNGFVDDVNFKKLEEGSNYLYNPTTQNGIIEHNYNNVPNSIFNMLSVLDANLESLSGVKSFSEGINSTSLGGSGSATATQGALNSSATRRLDKVRNIAENLVIPMLRKWLSYNSMFLNPEQVTRLTGAEYVPFSPDDVDGDLDMKIEVSTSEDNARKSAELNFSLQSAGQADDPEIRKMIRSEIFRLQGLPDMAKKVLEYQPEPNPQEEKLAELQMAKLEVEIALEQARVKEIQANSLLLEAKIQTEETKAQKNDSDSTFKEAEITEKTSMVKHEQQMEIEKSRADVARMNKLSKDTEF